MSDHTHEDREHVLVRALGTGDTARCQEIASGLPQYFSADVPEQIGRDIALHGGWVLLRGDTVQGFAVTRISSSDAAEILWAAVDAHDQSRGLGTTLISAVLVALKDSGVRLVEVKTLDPSAGYKPYIRTHAFWLARGFVQIDVIDPLPGWDPGNPSSILVAALTTTT